MVLGVRRGDGVEELVVLLVAGLVAGSSLITKWCAYVHIQSLLLCGKLILAHDDVMKYNSII